MTKPFNLAAAIFTLLILHGSPGQSQTPFYQGKTVRIIVGFSPGGSYDLWSRVIATHMGRYIPGNPTFVVQNMTGGGSMVAANYIHNVAKPDGLTFAVVTPALYTEQISGRKEVQYDWFKFSYLGSPEKTARIFYIRSDTPYKTVEDLRAAPEPPKCGVTGVGTASYYWPKLLAETFGFKLSLVAGYQGSTDVNLAIERGEMHCWGGTVQAFFGSEPGRTWAKSGFVRVLAQGGTQRDPRLSDVPTIWDLMDRHNKSQAVRGLTKVLLAPDDLGRPYFGPPGVPADRIRILRAAFAKVMSDPDVMADAQKKGLEPAPVNGDALETLVRELVQPAEVIQRMKTFLQN
jgi:tripartite-type tricarboxylate transporter receptor subunit TctC